jgi:hypothetical protein
MLYHNHIDEQDLDTRIVKCFEDALDKKKTSRLVIATVRQAE